jgi:hypothetical protein
MINKTNVDVLIYINKLMEGMNQMGIIESSCEEWGIEKMDLRDSLTENFSIQASMNFEENGDPIISESQFEEIFHRSLVECTIESMVDEGVLVKDLDGDLSQNVYSVNPERKDLLENGKEDDGE